MIEFYPFFRKLSLTAFIAAAVIFAIQMVSMLVFFQPDTLTSYIPEEYILDSAGQDRIHTTYKIAREHREYDLGMLKVYAIGGSSIRDLPPDDIMEREIGERLGRKIRFRAFGNYSSSVLDSMVLAFALPHDKNTVFIHGLTANRFQSSDALSLRYVFNFIKVPLVWQYAWHDLSSLEGFSVNYWVLRLRDFKNLIQIYFATRVNAALRDALGLVRQGRLGDGARVMLGAFDPIYHVRYNEAPWTKMVSKERLAMLFRTQEVDGYYANAEAGYSIFERMLGRTGDSRHIFFLGPWSPMAREAYGEAGKDMCRRLRGFSSGYPGRVGVMDCDGEFFMDEAFHDPVHLSHKGRVMVVKPLADMFARNIGEILNNHGGENS